MQSDLTIFVASLDAPKIGSRIDSQAYSHPRVVVTKADTAATGYSPWQHSNRPVGGLFHGLFIFCVIDQWLAGLSADGALGTDGRTYIARRRAEIADGIAIVSELSESPALTRFGRRFATWLL